MNKRTHKVAQNLIEYLTDLDMRLPRSLALKQFIVLVHQSHDRYGGASVHPRFGDIRGQALTAVSLYPERTLRINGREIPADLVEAFYRQNADLLQDPRVVLGTWYNADEDITYLDVTVVLPDQQEAIRLALTYNQIAVYDLAQEIEIAVGGTGLEPLDIPEEIRRLLPLRRTRKEKSHDPS